jgi:hypothetical protein
MAWVVQERIGLLLCRWRLSGWVNFVDRECTSMVRFLCRQHAPHIETPNPPILNQRTPLPQIDTLTHAIPSLGSWSRCPSQKSPRTLPLAILCLPFLRRRNYRVARFSQCQTYHRLTLREDKNQPHPRSLGKPDLLRPRYARSSLRRRRTTHVRRTRK